MQHLREEKLPRPWLVNYKRFMGALAVLSLLLAACGPVDSSDGGDIPEEDAGQFDLSDPSGAIHATSLVSLFVEPGQGMTPVLNAINGAKTSVWLGVYMLTDKDVTNALLAASKRGLEVRVILDNNSEGGGMVNDEAFASLGKLAKVASTRFVFTHEKIIIVDGTTLWVMTMNLADSAANGNREYLLVDTDPLDLTEAKAIFSADWAGTDAPMPQSLVVSPVNARTRLYELIDSAKTEIDVEWEAFSDYQMRDKLILKAQAGVIVKVVIPSESVGTSTELAMKTLKIAKGQIRLIKNPTMHAKMILVDHTVGFIGSENGTANSLDNNREMGVIWRNAQVAAKVDTTFKSDFQAATPL